MTAKISFVKDLEFEYGRVDRLDSNIRRVIARNPSVFTLYGTGTYIIGNGEVGVIDPGPFDETHISAIERATRGETITHVFVTHTHIDHSPGCALLRERCGVLSYGFGPHRTNAFEQDGFIVEEGCDIEFRPDVYVKHGDIIEGNGWQMECVYTPGHTSNHVCYQLRPGNVLFSGDHVMGWSTSVISPPDGDMETYMSSLKLLLSRNDKIYWPTHGPAIVDPKTHVKAFIAHRTEREHQIKKHLAHGHTVIVEMIPEMYASVDSRLWPAAARSVFAAIVYMVKKGDVTCDGEPSISSEYRIN